MLVPPPDGFDLTSESTPLVHLPSLDPDFYGSKSLALGKLRNDWGALGVQGYSVYDNSLQPTCSHLPRIVAGPKKRTSSLFERPDAPDRVLGDSHRSRVRAFPPRSRGRTVVFLD